MVLLQTVDVLIVEHHGQILHAHGEDIYLIVFNFNNKEIQPSTPKNQHQIVSTKSLINFKERAVATLFVFKLRPKALQPNLQTYSFFLLFPETVKTNYWKNLFALVLQKRMYKKWSSFLN